MHTPPPAASTEQPAACGITGHALVVARQSEIPQLRDRPGPAGSPVLPARFLRHCDEQTVVGMHAVLRVLAARGEDPVDVSRHAVVAASCQIGRITAARTLAGLATGGGVSVSTHIVPQCSLHSAAGAVSVGLGMRGPHIGVGGGTDALSEGLVAAATIVRPASMAGDPPCVWLVATEWEEEPALDEAGAPEGDPVCRGLALAIEPDVVDGDAAGGRRGVATDSNRAPPRTAAGPIATLSLALRHSSGPREPVPAVAGGLVAFARALDMCRDGTALVSWAVECPWGAEVRITRRSAALAAPSPTVRRREAA